MGMQPEELGQHLARRRRKLGVGLRELSRSAGMSPASLSAIEKGQSSPTLATLHKVLKALGTNFAEFFAAPPARENSPVFRAAEMRALEDAHRRYILLFPKRSDLRFEMVHETITPTETETEWETHNFDLGGVVLEGGPMRLELAGQGEWELNEGDAFYIEAGQRHRALNLGDGPLKLITVADPPRY